jgi:large subunit ribosomal protein L22
MSKRNQMDRRTRRKQLPQSGYTQLLQGSRLATARSVQVDMHVKHCFEVCRAIKNKTAGEAIAFLNQVLKIDSNRADVRRKAAAVPFRLGSGNKRKRRFPVKASREIIKVIESAMENARYQYEDIDAEEMLITHIAAHRGRIRKGWIPRARGRATPSNHYQVNLEVFLEDMNTTVEELEDEF